MNNEISRSTLSLLNIPLDEAISVRNDEYKPNPNQRKPIMNTQKESGLKKAGKIGLSIAKGVGKAALEIGRMGF